MIIRESLDFERGLDPKKAMGLGMVSFTSECSNVEMKGNKPDFKDLDTKEFFDFIKELGIKYEFIGLEKSGGPFKDLPAFQFTGTRKSIITLLMEYFDAGGNTEEFTKAKLEQIFRNYNEERDSEKLWDVLT